MTCSLREVRSTAIEVQGENDAPLVVVLGGISASRHVATHPTKPAPGWWDAQVGPARAIDPARYRVLGLDWLGTPGVSTADQAGVVASALDDLGVEAAHAIIGASYGGMVALAFGALHPGRVHRLLVLSAAHESHPMATALRVIQRRIVRLAAASGREGDGVALARALAMTTYRTADEFAARFDRAPRAAEGRVRFEVEEYLEEAGARFAERFDAGRFLALSESLDRHHVAPEDVTVPTHLLAVREDSLVPPWQMRTLRRRLGGEARLSEIESRYGHDAFLKEVKAVEAFLVSALEERPADGRQPVLVSAPECTATRAVRAGIGSDREHGAVVPPIHLSATFEFEGFGRKRAYDYTRTANPTRDHLAAALADLEGGAGALITSSGMSAVALVLQLLRPGDRVVAPHDCYGGTRRALLGLAARGHFEVEFLDWTRAGAAEAALAHGARLAWVETPSNPLLRITDLRRAADAAHRAGALLVVDNTFLSPALQRPIAFGADLVVHSTTKYLNGHSDVVGGAVIARETALSEELAWWANCLGLGGSPFDGWLTLRGLRTLHPRLRAHQENAAHLAELLVRHPAVAAVHYPGLPAHPGHAVARAQQEGFGAIVSFELAGGEPAVEALLDGLVHFSLAESLGGVESLVAHPATMTHASMTPDAQAAAGITGGLIRLSVGIEDGADLTADLLRGLDRARTAGLSHDRGGRE